MLRQINEYLKSGEVEGIKIGSQGEVMVTYPNPIELDDAFENGGQLNVDVGDGSNNIQAMGVTTDGKLYQLFYSALDGNWYYTPIDVIPQTQQSIASVKPNEVLQTDLDLGAGLSANEIATVLNDNNKRVLDTVPFYIVDGGGHCWFVTYIKPIGKFAIEKLTMR